MLTAASAKGKEEYFQNKENGRDIFLKNLEQGKCLLCRMVITFNCDGGHRPRPAWSLPVTVMVDAGLGQLSALSVRHSPSVRLTCFMVKAEGVSTNGLQFSVSQSAAVCTE